MFAFDWLAMRKFLDLRGMSINRFALISFLFLWCSIIYAQEDELSMPVYGKYGEGAPYADGRLYTYWEKNPIPRDARSPDTLNIKFRRIEVSSFESYIDERLFDSTFAFYNSSNFGQMVYKHPDSLETEYRINLENYCKLFRKAYGILKSYSPVKREIISFRDSVFRDAVLTCKASFNGVGGQLHIGLNATKNEKPRFLGMDFTPYDYNEVSFFSNVASLSLEYMKAKNITALMSDASKSFQERIKNKKKFEKSLSELKCDSVKQFTSNLSLHGKSTYARVVYDMIYENKYLSLVFISEDKKFKLYDLAFINKEKQ